MKNFTLLFLTIIYLFSCSRNRDSFSENEIDDNFVPSTLTLNLLSTNTANIDCFYENNYLKLFVDSTLIKNISWYQIRENNSILLGEFASQNFTNSGDFKAKISFNSNLNTQDTTINFILKYCDVFISAPNAFKPNGDGIFDQWAPVGEGIEHLTFTISNRRGKQLFESSSLLEGWNGNYDGKKMESGTYRYYLSGAYKNGYLFEKKGTFELIR